MRRFVPGALAGVSAALALAAPAAASVTVRIEAEDRTLLPRTAVPATGAPVGKPNQPTCAGSTALGALDRATGGQWEGPYSTQFSTYSVETLMGETHNAGNSSYWPLWINNSYGQLGVCGQQVQDGDELLFVPECYAAGCTPTSPLSLSGVPATVAPGATVTIHVVEYTQGATTTAAPSAGATVSYGGATATTGGDGDAQITFSGTGPQVVQATKAGHVRSASESTCVTTGSDGACGSTIPPGATPPAKDTMAPTATLAGLRDGQVFSRKRAPRTLRGTVSADPSGIKSVRLSILRRKGKRCWAFDGESERFKRHRCGGSRSFRIGDRAEWSYLLPKRLPRGRYTIRVIAIDQAGNDSATETEIRVR